MLKYAVSLIYIHVLKLINNTATILMVHSIIRLDVVVESSDVRTGCEHPDVKRGRK